jgi:hypothetical protein
VGENLKSWDQQLYHAEFAYNQSVNRNTGLSPFTIVYGSNPRTPLDLTPLPDLKRIHTKAEDLIAQIKEGHQLTIKNLQESTTKYKATAGKKQCPLEFEEGDFVWAVLTKDRFPIGEYNKLAACKICPVEIVKKINVNVYQLKLPSHIKTSNVFNVKHLVLFIDDSLEEDANSRANSLQLGEDDVDQDACEYMKKKRKDGKVEPPQRMATGSKTRATAEDQSSLELRLIAGSSPCAQSHSCLCTSAHGTLCYFLHFKLINRRYFTYLISIRVLRVLTDIILLI